MRGVSCGEASTSMVSAGSLAPLSMPWLRATAAATAISSARTGSCTATCSAAWVKIRCASAAEPTLTAMRPRSRSMSASRMRVVGALAGRRQQPRTNGRSGPRPTRCGRRRAGDARLARVGGQVCGSFVCVGGGPVAAAPLGPRADLVEGGDGSRRARRRRARGARWPGRSLRGCPGRRPARDAPRAARSRWRPGRPRTGRADAGPSRCHR